MILKQGKDFSNTSETTGVLDLCLCKQKLVLGIFRVFRR